MTARVQELEKVIASWPGVSIHPHRFAGRVFRFGKAEIGHVHAFGSLDIPFTRSIRNARLAEGLAEEHGWVPDSGWVAFSLRSDTAVPHSLRLTRLSYLRYALKQTSDPQRLFEEESGKLGLSSQFASLLQQFVPRPSSS